MLNECAVGGLIQYLPLEAAHSLTQPSQVQALALQLSTCFVDLHSELWHGGQLIDDWIAQTGNALKSSQVSQVRKSAKLSTPPLPT